MSTNALFVSLVSPLFSSHLVLFYPSRLALMSSPILLPNVSLSPVSLGLVCLFFSRHVVSRLVSRCPLLTHLLRVVTSRLLSSFLITACVSSHLISFALFSFHSTSRRYLP